MKNLILVLLFSTISINGICQSSKYSMQINKIICVNKAATTGLGGDEIVVEIDGKRTPLMIFENNGHAANLDLDLREDGLQGGAKIENPVFYIGEEFKLRLLEIDPGKDYDNLGEETIYVRKLKLNEEENIKINDEGNFFGAGAYEYKIMFTVKTTQ